VCADAGRSVEALRNFEPSLLSAASDFFAIHSGEIAFSASCEHCLDKDNRTVTIKIFFNYGAR
jgi:hypothetical protein